MGTNQDGVYVPRLLVIDDATIMRMRIAGIAREAGWEVVAEATNGLEGLARYDEHRPDLVTLDIVMPELDGVETLRALHTKSGDRVLRTRRDGRRRGSHRLFHQRMLRFVFVMMGPRPCG